MSDLQMIACTPWAPHPTAAPITTRPNKETLLIAANGTRTSVGGWQLVYNGVRPGESYQVAVEVAHDGVTHPRDELECVLYWHELAPNTPRTAGRWEYLMPVFAAGRIARFERTVTAPATASRLTIRTKLRWGTEGTSTWHLPRITRAESVPPREPVRVCVVTGRAKERQAPYSAEDNLAHYLDLCERACQTEHPDLIVTPEVCLQWRVPEDDLDLAVRVPGPEVDAFCELARTYHTRIVLGTLLWDGDACYNSALLIGPDGQVDGRYDKVHLAVLNESDSSVRPGDGFPVFDTEVGRLGCNICMDNSSPESARMVGLGGADMLLLPIMGDHRADRWTEGTPIYNEGRWRAIMRTRAIDNQLVMVVCRNEAQGSCIIDRKGDILAWNEGDREWIVADVALDDEFVTWNGGCFRDIDWFQRRPHIYGPYVKPNLFGPTR